MRLAKDTQKSYGRVTVESVRPSGWHGIIIKFHRYRGSSGRGPTHHLELSWFDLKAINLAVQENRKIEGTELRELMSNTR